MRDTTQSLRPFVLAPIAAPASGLQGEQQFATQWWLRSRCANFGGCLQVTACTSPNGPARSWSAPIHIAMRRLLSDKRTCELRRRFAVRARTFAIVKGLLSRLTCNARARW